MPPACLQIYSPKRVPSFFTTPDQAAWLAVRKGCAPAFSPDNIRRAFPVIRWAGGWVGERVGGWVGGWLWVDRCTGDSAA